MQGYGMPYQVVPFNKDASPRIDLRALLWDAADGSGRFSAVTMYPNIEAMGCARVPGGRAGAQKRRRRGPALQSSHHVSVPPPLAVAGLQQCPT